MAKCERGDEGGFRLWPLFFVAAFCRKLLEAVMCGVSHNRQKGGVAFRSLERRPRNPGSERLAELMQAEVSEANIDEAEAERRWKIEALEELQHVVGSLQTGDGGNAGADHQKEATGEVRRLAKDDAEARDTLAMLGAIPPLVGMLDSSNPEKMSESQVEEGDGGGGAAAARAT